VSVYGCIDAAIAYKGSLTMMARDAAWREVYVCGGTATIGLEKIVGVLPNARELLDYMSTG